MKPEELNEIITEAIIARPRDEQKYYHLCWWNDRLCCLPTNHTKDMHPSFFMASHGVLEAGLTPRQLELISERLLTLCRTRHVKIGRKKVGKGPGKRAGRARQGLKVTEFDLVRLQAMLGDKKFATPSQRKDAAKLRALLDAAEIVLPTEIPDDVVTLNSKVRLQDRRHDLSMILSLVFPGETPSDGDPEQTEAQILSPLGLSLFGRRIGDRIDGGVQIAELLYQPEARGDFHL